MWSSSGKERHFINRILIVDVLMMSKKVNCFEVVSGT